MRGIPFPAQTALSASASGSHPGGNRKSPNGYARGDQAFLHALPLWRCRERPRAGRGRRTVPTLMRWSRYRADHRAVVDSLGYAVLIGDALGQILHETPALRQLLE